jgi:sugar O-acyltransferase (sialic acid O-acetyltransferase NeuD family)
MPLAREQLRRTEQQAWDLVFLDDSPTRDELNGHRVMTYSQWLGEPASSRSVSVAIADSGIRENVVARCRADSLEFFEVRAANVVVMDDVQLGDGAILCPFVTLTCNIRIGEHFHANLYSYVEHDCRIGNYVTFAPGVHCNGNVVVEDHAYVGAGAVLRQGRPGAPLLIGRGAVIGMGAVVTRNVAPGATVVGNPARALGAPAAP